jgi:predicted transcriptional regulator
MSRSEDAILENAILVLLTLSRGAESRKRILIALLSGPKNCNQLTRELKFDWWTVRKHIQFLLKENMITSLEFGRITYYKLTAKGEELIRDIQKQATNSGGNKSKGNRIVSLNKKEMLSPEEATN